MEEDKLELARSLEAKAAAKGVKLILPTDVVLADKFSADANTKVPSLSLSLSLSLPLSLSLSHIEPALCL